MGVRCRLRREYLTWTTTHGARSSCQGAKVEIAKALIEATAAALRQRDERIALLESRLAKIERSKAISYRGTFIEREAYDAGDYCTLGGSLWCAIRDTTPGDAPGRSASWRLAVKGGAT